MKNKTDPFARPLDALLERLRWHELAYRPHEQDVERWIATCPCCANEMMLRESYIGAAVTVVCGFGCHESRIVSALAADPRTTGKEFDVAQEAAQIAHRALELVESICR